jgi:hypothetical protein
MKDLKSIAQLCKDVYADNVLGGVHAPCDAFFSTCIGLERDLYIIFRGSDSFVDWRYNVDHETMNWRVGNNIHVGVHSGFVHIWESIRQIVWNEVRERLKDVVIQNVIFCGHSLGGVMATLAIADSPTEFWNIDKKLITFGAPRVGDDRLWNYIYGLPYVVVKRFVNSSDVIPFLNASNLVSVDEHTVFLNGRKFLPELRQKTKRLFLNLLILLCTPCCSSFVFNDHTIDDYIHNLE